MRAEITGSDSEDGVGVDIYDSNGNYHWIALEWNGEIAVHETDDYPNAVEDRTDEQQQIMNQVAARARYEAQQAFPEEDILHDLWNPEFLKRGVEALSNYPMSAFNRDFRPFFEALDDPWPLIDHDRSDVQDASIVVRQPFTITADDRIGRVADVSVEYVLEGETESRFVGPMHDEFEADVIACELIPIPFVDDYPYEDHFHVIVMQHLLAQVRDTYLHMGERPPEAYLVDGPGKISGFHGDGIRRDPDEIHIPDDYDFTVEFPNP